MRKFAAFVLAAVFGACALTGCADDRPEATPAPVVEAAPAAETPAAPAATVAPAATPAPAPTATPAPAASEPPADAGEEAPAAASGVVKTGLGIVTGTASSAPGSAVQVDSTMAAITIDENNVITKLSIDAAQTRVAIDAAGQVTGDVSAPIPSKKEKQDAYNMRGQSEIGKEWFEQAQGFEEWAVGKTVEEVTGMATKALNDAHPMVPDVPDLAASVTINVGEFIDAVAKAALNAKEATVEGEYKTGLGIITTATGKSAASGAAGQVQVTSDTVALTVDASGVIVAASLDSGYTTVQFDATGAFITDITALAPSKQEQGDAYDMRKVSAIGKEWNEQVDGLCDWAIGKTVAEVTGMPLNGGKATDADVTASTTITVTELLNTFAVAGNNAK